MLVAPDGPLRQNRGPTLPQNDNDAVHVLCFCRLRGRGPQRSMLGVRGGRSLLVHQRAPWARKVLGSVTALDRAVARNVQVKGTAND